MVVILREPTGPARAADTRHLVLVGLNFIPRRATGDKNFWASLLPLLATQVDRISIISVRAEPEPREHLRLGACEIDIRYVAPAMRATSNGPGSGQGVRGWRGGSHPRFLGLVAKQLVTRRVIAELGDVLRDGAPGRVHLMDNFGPANHLLTRAARRHGAPTSVTAIAYERRGRRLYDSFLRLSYRVPGMTVVALSRGLEHRLRGLGVRRRAITRIPWGVEPGDVVADVDRRAARRRLGVPEERPVVLWAGFIQQVREPDFHLALALATAARDEGLDATFMFAFKPETFRPEYAALHRPDAGVHVMPTPVDVFADARAAADLLISPIEDRECIVAPPLTWIECMSTGLPVLSTDVPGADELIEDGRTGYRATDRADLGAKLAVIARDVASMREACRAKVASDYNLADIKRAYIALWFGAER